MCFGYTVPKATVPKPVTGSDGSPMGVKENRMLVCVLLLFLNHCTCQASEKDNSTQMYYIQLKIDTNVMYHMGEILRPFVRETNVRVDDLRVTTVCESDSGGTKCVCGPSHKWSHGVCGSNLCCNRTECNFQANSTHVCESNSTVTIAGSLTLEGQTYKDCLTEVTSPEYRDCSDSVLNEMKKVYSTLRGFDVLTITQFRFGSVIVDFEMTIVSGVKAEELIEKSRRLSDSLSGSVYLETTGMVHLTMPPEPVCYRDTVDLQCTSQENLEAHPQWFLRKQEDIFDITTGTVSDVTILRPTETKVRLRGVSSLWAGEYLCVYQQRKGGIIISHKATARMDVALLPDVDASTDPQFPRCRKRSDVVNLRAKCEASLSSERYTVSWEGDGITQTSSFVGKDAEVFTAEKIIGCNGASDSTRLFCVFRNRCNQELRVSIPIHIIYEEDIFCGAEGDWGNTKAGYTAVLKCENTAGLRQRKCSLKGKWWEEESACVHLELDSVLQSSLIADIGLGALSDNAAQAFSRLENVTAETHAINSYANMNVSVSVLSTLGEKLHSINKKSTTDNALESFSNLLEKSLEKSWKSSVREINSSLAERYLSSAEQLLSIVNITHASKKPNIEFYTCNRTRSICASSVFNVNISLRSSSRSSVKTAGFKQLDGYLPYDQAEGYTPNSIVVSATTAHTNRDQIEITIDFPFSVPRPPHVDMSCVWWDGVSRQWSPRGCRWAGPSNEVRCICSHLSSFSILMSRYPLEIPWMAEITYGGLSVSVVSLVVTLLIELIVWNDVVKTNTLYLRHMANVNISICLLVADSCFLASSKPRDIPQIWCQTFVVLKHFCYLAMFFWMLSLSCALLHQAVFLFHTVSRKNYLRFSLVLGYVCPLLIVFVSFITNGGGAEGQYFSRDTCWLVYDGLMKGSIYCFLIPVGIIVFVNVFSMLVVILKLLNHPSTEKVHVKEKMAAKTVMRSVIILTPIFGVTWITGFAVMLLDLTNGPIALAVNYMFVVMNAFQGLFILLTTAPADHMTREALRKRLKIKAPQTSTSISSIRLDVRQK